MLARTENARAAAGGAQDSPATSAPDISQPAVAEADFSAAEPEKRSLLTSTQAFIALISSRLIIRIGKFQLAHRVAEKWPTRGEKNYDFDYARQLVAFIDRSSRFTTTKSWCLQRSLAVVLLLRFHGVPAELTIGVRRVPFYAHAWAELAGRVINDSPIVREKYAVIEQC